MSLNFDNHTVDAIKNLRGNANFDALVNGLGRVAHKALIASMAAPPELRVDQTAWARALRDMHTALVATAAGVNQRQVDFPGVLDAVLNTSDPEPAGSAQTPQKSDRKANTP